MFVAEDTGHVLSQKYDGVMTGQIKFRHYRRTNDECLQFFYVTNAWGNRYWVEVTDEDGKTEIWDGDPLNFNMEMWLMRSVKLPDGVYSVTLAFDTIYEFGTLIIDDVWIAPCDELSE